MNIQLNGEKKVFDKPLSLSGLLARLSLPKERVVVELNYEILPKDQLAETLLKEGDVVEIVQFVGGGARKKMVRQAHHSGALVIVESPAKCKTIHKYLGPGFEVAASMGHLVDLPKSKMGIDIEHDFKPQYIVVRDKKKMLKELKAKAKNKSEIYLACDPDREGEAISWHLKNELGEGKKVTRVVFNEITKEAVTKAFEHPTEINMDLVDAQQARRVLDRLVGYSLSPLLWQKVGKGLSAGRVQSVALRLIVDREREIQAFKPEEYWTIEAELKKEKGEYPSFTAKLEKIGEEKADLKKQEEAAGILKKIESAAFVVKDLKKQNKKRNPSAPFTTSKLQQSAYNALRFPAAKTMRIAQSLYEGVDIGSEGSVGLITYMRTDSVRISDGAMTEVREFISKTYGKDYLPAKPNVYKSKKQAQEAHEAIRATSVLRRPQDIERYLAPDQFKLYSLIWEQHVSSQMTPAIVEQVTVDITADICIFRSTGSRIEFPGFLAVSGRTTEDADKILPPLAVAEALQLVKIEPNQHFTKPPGRFTDASLVKALEEQGIGRPSTYAPIIQTLTSRDYIRREGGALLPTELGMLITDLLVKSFSKLLEFDFTATMEEDLDRIEEGKAQWVEVVRNFYGHFSGEVNVAKDQMQTVKREAEPTDELCDKCGKPMVIKWGRHGRFMSCSGWPDCKNAKSLPTGVACPQCGNGQLVRRRARSGKGRSFYGCSQYPECTFIANRLPSETSKNEAKDGADGSDE
ncbi:MAG: type I DNA topoisomerase [Candidatus Omnitrophica bacterium]|nr:type I DNA topoisomerase [Candidatus Omnitrophota bacterium]